MKIDIDAKTQQALTEIAALRNISVDDLLSEFAAKEKRYWEERAEDLARLETMKQRGGITHNDMMTWLEDLAIGKDV